MWDYQCNTGCSSGCGPSVECRLVGSLLTSGVVTSVGFRNSLCIGGCEDGCLYVWREQSSEDGGGKSKFKLMAVLSHSSMPITNCDAHDDLVVTGDEMGVVRLYKVEEGVAEGSLVFVAEFKVLGKVVMCEFDDSGVLMVQAEGGEFTTWDNDKLPRSPPPIPSAVHDRVFVEDDGFFKGVIENSGEKDEVDGEEDTLRFVKERKERIGKKDGRKVEWNESVTGQEKREDAALASPVSAAKVEDDSGAAEEEDSAPRVFSPAPSPQPPRPTPDAAAKSASLAAPPEGPSAPLPQVPPRSPSTSSSTSSSSSAPPSPNATGKVPKPYLPPHTLSAPTLHSSLHYQSDVKQASSQKFDATTVSEPTEARVFAAKIASNVDRKTRLYGDLQVCS